MDSLIKIHWCIVPLYWKLFAKLLLKSCIVVTQSLLYMEKAAFISIRTSAACRFGVSQVNLYCTWLCVLYSTYMYCIKLLLSVGLEFHRSIYCKWLCVLYSTYTVLNYWGLSGLGVLINTLNIVYNHFLLSTLMLCVFFNMCKRKK